MTTYAENIGVMAATKIYSTAVFVVAALIAVVLGFSPKFGALIQAIPLPVMGGVSIVVFGLIAVAGAKIWVDNKVDFSDNKNLLVAAITLVLGTGDFTLRFGQFALGGIEHGHLRRHPAVRAAQSASAKAGPIKKPRLVHDQPGLFRRTQWRESAGKRPAAPSTPRSTYLEPTKGDAAA